MAAALLTIAFIEIGSHAVIDSQDLDHFQTLGICGLAHNRPLTVDCPTRHKPRGPESNLHDEMMIHAMILNDMTSPRSGISYRTDEAVESIVSALSGNPERPFHPPKQA